MASPNTDAQVLIALKKLRDEHITGGAITSYQISGRNYQFVPLPELMKEIEAMEWKVHRASHGIKTGVAMGRNW